MKKRKTGRFYMFVAVLLCAALAAAGCGKKPAPETSATPAESTAEETTAPETTAPETETETETETPTETETETETQTETETPAPAPEALVFYPMGETARADLDGDGTEEEITLSLEGTPGWDVHYRFHVNGQDRSGILYGDDISVDSPVESGFVICDLDTADGKREICVMDDGPSADPVTYFLRCEGGVLTHIGTVEGYIWAPDSNLWVRAELLGGGRLEAEKRLSVLQTWYTRVVWTLTDGVLAEEPQKTYPVVYQVSVSESGEELDSYKARKDLKVYKEMRADAETFTAAAGEKIWMTETDDKTWIRIQTEKSAGWLHIHEMTEVETTDGYVSGLEAIEGLFMAD